MRRADHPRSRRNAAAVLAGLLLACFSLAPAYGLEPKTYQVYIVLDTQFDKFLEVQAGFKAQLDKLLAAAGAKAEYRYLDTKLDAAQAESVVQAIKAGKPDLICTVNWPSAFADRNVTLKLSDPAYRFVSLNPIPVQSGVAKSWQKPGGNVTGVGVFLQFDSMLKVAKRVRPGLKEVAFCSWDAMKDVNAYFEQEIKASCQRVGLKLIEFKRNAAWEDEADWLLKMDREHPNAAVVIGISAWVHRDGSAADALAEGAALFSKQIHHLLLLSYDEATMKALSPLGTCVIWDDLGAQLAERGYKVLSGAKPGELAWEYPRRHRLMFNTALAKLVGVSIPNDLLTAAYRVYTDLDGGFVGTKN